MNHTPSGRLGLGWCAATFLLSLLTVYVAAYFCLARPGVAVRVGPLRWAAAPNYWGAPEIFFRPIHCYDRSFLRPAKWSGYCNDAELTIVVQPHTITAEDNDMLGFGWILPTSATSSVQANSRRQGERSDTGKAQP
jgi:hypothetical protein